MEILELKNTVTEINLLDGHGQNRDDRKEAMNLKIEQWKLYNLNKETIDEKVNRTSGACGTIPKYINVIRIPGEEKECSIENILKEIAENYPNLANHVNL